MPSLYFRLPTHPRPYPHTYPATDNYSFASAVRTSYGEPIRCSHRGALNMLAHLDTSDMGWAPISLTKLLTYFVSGPLEAAVRAAQREPVGHSHRGMSSMHMGPTSPG